MSIQDEIAGGLTELEKLEPMLQQSQRAGGAGKNEGQTRMALV